MLTLDTIEREIQLLKAHGDNRADVSFLAALYICKAYMDTPNGKNALRANEAVSVAVDGDSEFYQAIRGKDTGVVLAVMNELMETLRLTNPRLYAGVMRELNM